MDPSGKPPPPGGPPSCRQSMPPGLTGPNSRIPGLFFRDLL
ncbi:hypothetical protein CORC01_14419 [Colletotrichum orchidophilum]|uniref:Uncharacterized protein n=1 Tax=Colletotrichum orchidophilum TaxID=1209926 RepID=A0A1G4AML3_9PEZI|nr:uncharacterized protein CORC01_14419 [Colletotrichum orchidophilum]OHE90283.1 hypothetical protein CORC01_14419 [Colletotrichum orchidophilum]